MFFEQNAFRTRFSDLIDQNNYNSNWKKKYWNLETYKKS